MKATPHRNSCTVHAADDVVRALGCTCDLGHTSEAHLPSDFQLAALLVAGVIVYMIDRAWRLGRQEIAA